MKTGISSKALVIALPASLALAGCSSAQKQSFSNFAQTVYTDTQVVAQKIQQAVQIASKDVNAAAEFLAPYFVPTCQIVVTLNAFAVQSVQQGILNGDDANVKKALEISAALATNAVVVAAAQQGVIPSNPVVVLTGVIQSVGSIMKLTGKTVTPTAVVASGTV